MFSFRKIKGITAYLGVVLLYILILNLLSYGNITSFKSDSVSIDINSVVPQRTSQKQLGRYAFKNIAPATIPEKYLKENKRLCSVSVSTTIIFMIESHPLHFDRREAIRETWANSNYFSSSVAVKLLFLFGRLLNTTLQHLLEEEFKEYSDILQGDFLDSYHNLSLSTIMGMNWINTNCKNAKFIIKVDDDMVVNTFVLERALKENYISKTKQVVCYRRRGVRVSRKIKSKHFVPEELFENIKYYPLFCEGKFVLMTNDIIPALLNYVSLTPHFWIEDVYMYGLVMNNVPQIEFREVTWGREIEIRSQKAKRCLQGNVYVCSFFVVGAHSGKEIREIWSLMQNHKPRVSKYLLQYLLSGENFHRLY